MFRRGILLVAAILVLGLTGCGATAEEINNSGHESYLSGDYPAALEVYKLAQESSSDSGEPFYNSGNARYRMGEYEGSVEDFDASLRHAEGELRSRGFFNRGNALFQQQQYRQAVEAYEEVLRMDPDDQEAKHNLELALKQMPSPEEELDQQQEEEDEQEEKEEEDQQQEDQEQEQDESITEAHARQILESVGESAQTLQQRRGQTLVSPKPPSEFDW